MLDNIASTSETLFKRQVQPAAEGHLRPEARQENQSNQSGQVRDRAEKRAELQLQANARLERQREASEISRRRHEPQGTELNSAPSKAAEMAEKLAKSVREARQEEARHQRYTRYSPGNRSRQIDQVYLSNLPVQQNRLVDEMV